MNCIRAAERRTTILADVCEAVIGAVYLDGGYEAATKFIDKYWRPRALAPGRELRDAKTRLQEWAQKQGLPPPSYRQVERKGPDHQAGVPDRRRSAGHRIGRGRGGDKTRRSARRRGGRAAGQGVKIDE